MPKANGESNLVRYHMLEFTSTAIIDSNVLRPYTLPTSHQQLYKKVDKTLTTLNYIFNGVWEMNRMPGYQLSTLSHYCVFRSFQ